jgi:hypothetical protein
LATKAHFSSNWTSWVAGGKSHDLVVGILGVPAGRPGVAVDGILIDADQPPRLADTAPLVEVLDDRDGLVLREARGKQGGALALGEALLTGTTDEHQAAVLAIAETDAEVVAITQAVIGAVGVLAAEAAEVIHERASKGRQSCGG